MLPQARWLGVLLLVFTIALSFSDSAPLRASLAEEQRSYRILALLGEAFERVRDNYVEDIDDEALVEAAIKGMMEALDPYSDYLGTKHYKEMRERSQGHFGGLGIEVTLDETGYVRVVSPIDETPAARAGIMPGDLITHIDGEELPSQSLSKSVEKMRGPVNSSTELQILRNDVDVLTFTLVRENIKLRSVRTRVLEDNIGYVRIVTFNGNTTQEVDQAIRKLKENNPERIKGFIIDLRNNPGGLLEEAVQISDGFLERGEIVSIRSRHNEHIQRFQATKGDWTDNLPLAILINNGSASASEIVAGALQDHQRATLIGTSSFGKGSVQTIFPLSRNDSALKLTTQYYYTPSGRSISKVGLQPDIEVFALDPIVNEDGSLSPPKQDVQLTRTIAFIQEKLG